MLIYEEKGWLPETLRRPSVSDPAPAEPIIRFYHSQGCGASHIVSPVVDQLVESFSGFACLERIDVDGRPSTLSQDRVTQTPTLVFRYGDEVVDRIVGPTSRLRIDEGFRRLAERTPAAGQA